MCRDHARSSGLKISAYTRVFTDEFLLGGEVQEASKKNVLKAIEQADLMQEEAETPRSILEEIGLTKTLAAVTFIFVVPSMFTAFTSVLDQ
ncbi:unnamed protein product [Ranitomeya imitator]|uniref:Uncharacterized protein n=1 Tax=Ranitomeya imitator TaxID=111125 RepID=A0ABN9M3D9_9NEOB|nr:unnamed protein product [Ranitomeya imitator]